MLSNENLIEVACETHDDILLIRKLDGVEVAEYVQVKAEHLPQLWSVARLCERNKTATNQNGAGTSILEKSLGRDAHHEPSWFSIVTCRQIDSDLEVLSRERPHEDRKLSHELFKSLVDKVNRKIGNFASKKGNGTPYWLVNACWQVISDSEIIDLNEQRLARVLHSLGEPPDPDAVRSVYENLRTLAKFTAELPLMRRKEKYVSRSQLIAKIKNWNEPYPGLGQVERLEQKMKAAGLDVTCVEVAKEQRRFYLQKKRSGGYLSTDKAEDIDQHILDTLHKLRSSLDSGQLVENGVQFHDRCLKEIAAVNSAAVGGDPVPRSYLSGCMYEIAARCRHRYIKERP